MDNRQKPIIKSILAEDNNVLLFEKRKLKTLHLKIEMNNLDIDEKYSIMIKIEKDGIKVREIILPPFNDEVMEIKNGSYMAISAVNYASSFWENGTYKVIVALTRMLNSDENNGVGVVMDTSYISMEAREV